MASAFAIRRCCLPDRGYRLNRSSIFFELESAALEYLPITDRVQILESSRKIYFAAIDRDAPEGSLSSVSNMLR